MGNCSIHGKHSAKTCGFCGLGNRIKDMSVHTENIKLKHRITGREQMSDEKVTYYLDQLDEKDKRIAELEESLRISIAGQSVEKKYSENLEAKLDAVRKEYMKHVKAEKTPVRVIDAIGWILQGEDK